MRTAVIKLALAAALAAVGLTAAAPLVAREAAAPPAGTLAGLELVDVRGERYPGPAAAGRVTIVGFWATWCPSCKTELPDLIELGAELKAAGAELILVSVDRVPEKAARQLERLGYQGEAAYDPGAHAAAAHGITGIPTALLLDAAGREKTRIVGSGADSLARIRAEVSALLSAEVD